MTSDNEFVFSVKTFARTDTRCRRVCTALQLCFADNAYPFLNGSSGRTVGIAKDAHKLLSPGSCNIESSRKRILERALSLFMSYSSRNSFVFATSFNCFWRSSKFNNFLRAAPLSLILVARFKREVYVFSTKDLDQQSSIRTRGHRSRK